jgi:DNA polymerase-3 subunit delta
VLAASQGVDKRGALYKRIQQHGTVYEAVAPRERELPAWVAAQARARGRTLTADAAACLVEAIGRELGTLDAAVERLTLFVEGDAPIDLAAVEQVVPQSRTRTVWELLDAVADRKAAEALARAHELMGQGEAALKLLTMIARQFRQLLVGRGARASGASAEECAAAAGIPPFRARAFARQLDNYSGRELLAALERLADADRALKSSKLDEELILEGALLDLCRPGGAAGGVSPARRP